MQQIKIFKGLESEVGALETEVNSWIKSSGARVLSITGNISAQGERLGGDQGSPDRMSFFPSDVLLVILYETSL